MKGSCVSDPSWLGACMHSDFFRNIDALMGLSTDVYIQRILREQGIFALPGVGTFQRVKRHAQLDGQHLLPPRTELTFLPEGNEKVLLSAQLMAQLGWSREEALALEQSVMSSLRAHVEAGKPYEFAGFGTLSVGEQAGFEFAPSEGFASVAGGPYWGLQPVTLPTSFSSPSQESIITADMASSSSSPKHSRGIGWKTFLILLGLPILGVGLVKLGPVQIMSRQQAINVGDQDQQIPRMEQITSPMTAAETPTRTQEPTASAPTADEPTAPATQPAAPASEPEPVPPADLVAEATPSSPEETAPQPEATSPAASSRRVGAPQRTRSLPTADEESEARGTGSSTNISVLDTSQKSPSLTPTSPPAAAPSEAAVSQRGIAESKKYYHLVVSSFYSKSRATDRMTEFKSFGYDPIALVSKDAEGKMLYRISIFRSNERAKVEAFYNRFQTQGGPKGWIFDRRKE